VSEQRRAPPDPLWHLIDVHIGINEIDAAQQRDPPAGPKVTVDLELSGAALTRLSSRHEPVLPSR
jgi:hypothetical protein